MTGLLGKLMLAWLIENIYLQRSKTKFAPVERESHKQSEKVWRKLSHLGPLVALRLAGSS